ncbi:hypothetical protein AMECASPLE_038357 [Ameca splendens]|uniref:Uncharacterized protein n=1 Tax=Ameca splendens TaxID=208324 RepID=A0ABV0XL64_9TELE
MDFCPSHSQSSHKARQHLHTKARVMCGKDYPRGTRTPLMYVQKLPKPDELLNVMAGDFHKTDQCVAQQVFDSLNNSVWSSNGASPRCDLWQADISVMSTWRYDCSVLNKIKTAKMLLQAWAEGHSRDWSRTWWGLQEYEVKEWVIPCLSQTDKYWVKYQYQSL